MGRTGFGGRVSVAAATALLTLCLAGVPLYVSSSATAALGERLERTCPANSGLLAFVGLDNDRVSALLDERIPQLRHVSSRIDTYDSFRVEFRRPDHDDGLSRGVILINRTGQEQHIVGTDGASRPAASLQPGEVLLPEYFVDILGLQVGERLEVKPRRTAFTPPNQRFEPNPEFPPKIVTLAGSYDEIPARPIPNYWCGVSERFLPTANGDAPPPVAFVNAPREAVLGAFSSQSVELWVEREGLTRHQAREAAADIDRLVDDLAELVGDDPAEFRHNADVRTGLPGLVAYSESLSELVRRTVQPVRIAGVLAGIGLLGAASVLLAREQRRELRLRQLRGEPLRLTFTRNLGRAGVSALVGAAIGLAGAIVAVRSLGPSSLMEPDPLREAVGWTLVGALGATAIVATGVTAVANRVVDPKPVRRRWVRVVPWELLAVALAIVTYLRLDRIGGIRLVGSEAKGGDLLAVAFPVVAILVPVVVLARPTAWLVRRLRFSGRRLWLPLRVGWRRVAHESWTSVVMAGAVAIAAGTFVLAGTLTESAEAMLHDKAAAYLGTDLVLTVRPGSEVPETFPEGLAGRATVVERTQATVGGVPVDIIGVDPETFTDGSRWRSDLSSRSLEQLVESLSGGGGAAPWPVVVAGFEPATDVIELRNRDEIPMEVREVARWLPGAQAGTGQVFVRDDLFDELDMSRQTYVWVRDPPADALERLGAAGFEIRAIRAPEDVFEATSFLAVSWSYDAFAGLGLLVALVTLVAEVVVLQARRTSRQSAWVVTNPMGVSAPRHAGAIFFEIAIPIVAGVIVGCAAAVVAARASVRRLDTLRHLDPPAVAHVDASSLAAAGLALGVTLVALTILGTVSMLRARPMEVMRGTA